MEFLKWRRTVGLWDVLRIEEVCLNVMRRLPVEDVADLSSSCKALYMYPCIRKHLHVERINKLPQSSKTSLLKLLEHSGILHRILSFLSVGELMNFQLVSKRCKVPLTDHSFINLHHFESKKKPQLIISTPNPGILATPAHGFEGGAAIYKASIPWAISSNILSPLNGIFPFINMSTYSCCFYNLSTRQKSPWCTTALRYQEGTMFPFYGFGFDPINLLHKLVCIWEISRDDIGCGIVAGQVEYVVEVLTVGENQWRMLGEIFPKYRPYRKVVSAQDSIYIRIRSNDYFPAPVEEVIVGFDIRLEKFRIIKLPYIMVHSFKAESRQGNDLIQLDGHIALLDRQDDHLLNLWISDDCCLKGERTPEWTKEIVNLPFAWKKDTYLSLTPVTGTKNIIFKLPPDSKDRRLRGYLDLLIYNRENKMFRGIKIDGISPMMKYPYPCSMYIYNESVLPVAFGAKKLDK